jgi:spore coat protein H
MKAPRLSLVLLAVASVLWPARAVAAQSAAKGKPADFFQPNAIHTFHLVFTAAEWDRLQPPGGGGFAGMPPGGGPGRGGPMGGNGAERYPQATATLEVDGEKWGDLRVRFKGNSSFNFARDSLKHSLKLDFNDLDPKAEFYGLDKLNLNNDAMDASGLRETLAYDVFRAAGIAASRTALAKVYLTVEGRHERRYLGAYTAVEQVDKDFLKDRFGQKSGLLLKPEQNANLGYLGENWSTYEQRMGEKVDAKAAEGRRFVEFVRFLNLAGEEDFARRLDGFVDVDRFLRFVAVQSALVNYDSPLMSGHNYYLYLNPKDNRFVWIPWDLNEAFGSFGVNGANAALMSILPPSAPNAFRMADRVLAVPGMRARYETVVRELLAGPFRPERLDARVAELAPLARSAVAADPLISARTFERQMARDPSTVAVPANPPRNGPNGPPQAPPNGRPGGPGGPGGPAGRLGQGVMPGPGGEKPPLVAFYHERAESIADQLAGRTQGLRPQGGPGRGGPGGGGPGGGGPGGGFPGGGVPRGGGQPGPGSGGPGQGQPIAP